MFVVFYVMINFYVSIYRTNTICLKWGNKKTWPNSSAYRCASLGHTYCSQWTKIKNSIWIFLRRLILYVLKTKLWVPKIVCFLTPTTPLIPTGFTYSKWNMGEICGFKFHLLYEHASQLFCLKFLCAQKW